ncbi:phage scaffolding protein [Anaerocolumna xylanovorans]|uniref:Phage minor structural protein GP20 n=1 Tax=Anaerocolumna xylanovorans DSM 12503 TaxID=1121345 RepID=A0A1M7Y6A0_9FIRM|nr:phage scaffolding protein [Anaerocolumna xylanovorans]SHO48124.1 Phage minor structural protein GP20 [Anaerocolumna xylanovorans DSM 12503]
MKKKQLLQLGLTEEISIKVLALYKEEQSVFIPKARFDEINQKKKELEWQVMHQKEQIDEMRGSNLICQKLKEEMLGLLWQAGQEKKKDEEKYRDVLLYSLLLERLSSYKYAELIFEKMDKQRLVLTPEGEVLGAEEEIERVRTAYQELFGLKNK